ncbi:hypothetical protein HMPREF0290_0556 [Corynebacterium efficiens YS-314]|uniref:Putative difensin n=1 Tax=Corynebacterium efficiens (strain DSM 44549 / YS-314 / AJ 12310 / JCM 11189 / NBRC 100395) TaxID=196164 RepID=Q8FLE1_COREF|nr:hypothetical protein HMPREF0290_0556 [Corynebacterium efficiens YS-314]BAC19816.1 putative difensin [Corynebacterium efficiens YS-314]
MWFISLIRGKSLTRRVLNTLTAQNPSGFSLGIRHPKGGCKFNCFHLREKKFFFHV